MMLCDIKINSAIFPEKKRYCLISWRRMNGDLPLLRKRVNRWKKPSAHRAKMDTHNLCLTWECTKQWCWVFLRVGGCFSSQLNLLHSQLDNINRRHFFTTLHQGQTAILKASLKEVFSRRKKCFHLNFVFCFRTTWKVSMLFGSLPHKISSKITWTGVWP